MNDINFLEEFNRLPQPLKELLSSSYLGQTVKDALTLAQIDQKRYDDLMNATSEVLRLHVSPNEFLKILTSQYNFSEKQAQIINKVINDRVFAQVSPLLKKDGLFSPTKDQQPNEESISKQTFTPFKSVSRIFKIPKTNIPRPISTLKSETIIINKQQPTLENKKTIEPQEEKIKEKEIKEEISEAKTEETVKEIPEIKIPEPLEINIEKPLQHNIEPPPVTIPEVPYEKQQKIKETLLKIMTEKKTDTPKIVEEMEKVEKEPKKDTPLKKKQGKSVAQISEITEVLSGQTENYRKKVQTTKKDNETILNIKIKEFQKKEKEEIQEPESIAYRKYIQKEEKPFGET